MAKDKRTLEECVSMARDLAEALGMRWLDQSLDEAQPIPGLGYEAHTPGAPFPKQFLLVLVTEEGLKRCPFGSVGMSYTDFWTAGCFALRCLDLRKEQQALEAVQPDVADCPQCMIDQGQPHEIMFHPRCSHDCQVSRNHHDLCDLCRLETMRQRQKREHLAKQSVPKIGEVSL